MKKEGDGFKYLTRIIPKILIFYSLWDAYENMEQVIDQTYV